MTIWCVFLRLQTLRICNTCFPLQQWCTNVPHCCTYIDCLVDVDFAIGWDSVIGLATGHAPEIRGSNSGGGEIFLTRRDRR
jgi:hypothetical protein